MNTTEKEQLKGIGIKRLSWAMIRRSIRLLDMEYKPSEIASELGATKEQVFRLITAGAPVRKDAKGHYWVHGETFARWLRATTPQKYLTVPKMADNEAFCIHCNALVIYTETKRRGNQVSGVCPKGHKTSRFVSLKAKHIN